MGAQCSHSKLDSTILQDLGTANAGLLWKHHYQVRKCLDCHKEVKVDVLIGKLTHHEYKTEMIEAKTCDHENHFEVLDESQIVVKQQTIVGTLARLMMGPAMDGIQYAGHPEAHAKCNRCDFKFWVEATFEKKWKDGVYGYVIDSKWKPIYIDRRIYPDEQHSPTVRVLKEVTETKQQ